MSERDCPDYEEAFREGQLSMTEESKPSNTGTINISGGHMVSGGGGFVIGIVVTLIVAFIIGGVFCDECEQTAPQPAPIEATE